MITVCNGAGRETKRKGQQGLELQLARKSNERALYDILISTGVGNFSLYCDSSFTWLLVLALTTLDRKGLQQEERKPLD